MSKEKILAKIVLGLELTARERAMFLLFIANDKQLKEFLEKEQGKVAGSGEYKKYKRIKVVDKESAIMYLQNIVNHWDAYGKHHKPLIDALKIVLKEIK